MSPSCALAERIRQTTKTGTDYAVAKALGMSQSTLKEVLDGKRNFGVEACVRASELLHEDLKAIIAEVEETRARTPEKKAFWEKRRPRLLPAVIITGIAAGVMYFTYVVSSEGLATSFFVLQPIHYAPWLYILTALVLTSWLRADGHLELRLRWPRATRRMVYKGKSLLAN